MLFAIGARHLAEARVAARSVREQHPELPIVAFFDAPTADHLGDDEPYDHAILQLEARPRSAKEVMALKLTVLGQTPFDHTVYLDTDTYVCGAFDELYELLEQFDMAMSIERRYRDEWPPLARQPAVPLPYRDFNQGVLAYRSCPAVLDAFAAAATIAAESAVDDQIALRSVLYRRPDVRVAPLTPEYNCRFHAFGYVVGPVKILHGRPHGRPHTRATFERVAARVNSDLRPRVYAGGSMTPLTSSRWGLEPDLPARRIRLYPARRARVAATIAGVRRRLRRHLSR